MQWNHHHTLAMSLILTIGLGGCGSLSKPDPYALAIEALDSDNPSRESKAIEHLKQTIAKQPDHHEAHNQLGLYAYQSGDFETAVEEFRAAIHWNPLSSAYRHNLVLALTSMGRLDEASHALDETLRMYPDDPNLLLDRAVLLHLSGDNRAALELLDRVEDISPSMRKVDTLRKQWLKP